MAGNNGLNIKMFIENLPEFTKAIKDMNDTLAKDFTPMVKDLSKLINGIKKIDYPTSQAIQAQKTGFSAGRNKTVVNDEIMNWAIQDSRRMKKLQSMIESAQEEQLRLIQEENNYKLERLREDKRHNKQSEDYRNKSLEFRKQVAMGLYDESRAFTADRHGFVAQALYRNSKNFANGNSSINSALTSIMSPVLGDRLGSAIGNSLLSSVGKHLRRRAEVTNPDGTPKFWEGKLTHWATKKGTKSGLGVNAAGGMIGMFGEAVVTTVSAVKTFYEKLLDAASNLEVLTAQLKVVTGSKSAAQETFGIIKDYAFNSPYTTTETTQIAVLLRQSGVLQTNLDKTIRMLGDLGMGSQERLTRISNNYAQILAAGRANSKDLREFANAGIPIYESLHKYFKADPDTDIGNTTEAVRKLAEEGKVTSNVITKVFEELTSPGGTFYGASKTYADTYTGQMNNLKDRLDIAKGVFTDIGANPVASWKMKYIKTAIKFYENLTQEGAVNRRGIKNAENLEERKRFGALAIEEFGNLKERSILNDEEFEALSEEEKKTAISLSEYRKLVESYIKKHGGKFSKKDGFTDDVITEIFDKGFTESFARYGAQFAQDYFQGLYQDSSSFAYKVSNLSSSGNIYKTNSEEYKAKTVRDERLKHLATIQKYKDYETLFTSDKVGYDHNNLWTGGSLDVLNFDELYDFWSSGFLSGGDQIVPGSKEFTQEHANELKKNLGMMAWGINSGLKQYSELPGNIGIIFKSLIDDVDKININDSNSINKVNKDVENLKVSMKTAKSSKKVSKEAKQFIDQLDQLVNMAFKAGYTPSDKPLDYKESFKIRTLRGVSGLDASSGNTIAANIAEIQRKQAKSIGTSVFKNRLKNSTLVDLVASGDLSYTGRKNDLGGMEVNYQDMGKTLQERFTDMASELSKANINLKEYTSDMQAYSGEVRKQIDMYTQLEETLQLGEDKLSDAFNLLDESQKSSLTTYGKVKFGNQEYSDLRFNESGVLQANIFKEGRRGKKIDNWVDVVGNNELTLVLDDLTSQIKDAKTDLLLLESRLKDNTIILTKINNLRDQGNNRRFGNILNNSNYLYSKGIYADKGSEFYKDANSVFASIFSDYMSMQLPNLAIGPNRKKEDVAKGFMDGKYDYETLRKIQELQAQAPYKDGKWILDQLESIIGNNLTNLIEELQKTQKTYDDQVGWRSLLASQTGLSYDTVKNKGSEKTIGIYGQLQSRDILKATMIGLGQSGAGMGDMSNLGVKDINGYRWNQTRSNLINRAVAGELGIEAMKGLKSGLEASRNAIIDLQATLLTSTDTTSENNKQITDVLTTLFSGNVLKGKLNGEEIELEQFERGNGTYGFRNKKTGDEVDTESEKFRFEKETTTKALESLSAITNASLGAVKLLEAMQSSIKAIEDDTRDMKVKNIFTGRNSVPFSKNSLIYSQFRGTSDSSSYIDYFSSAYNNLISNFAQSAIELSEMSENLSEEEIKKSVDDFIKTTGATINPKDTVEIIANSKALKEALDSHLTVDEILGIIRALGFDEFAAGNAAMNYGIQGVIADRRSSFDNLAKIYPSLNRDDTGEEALGFLERYRSGIFGVPSYTKAIEDIALERARKDNPDIQAMNLTDQQKTSARRELQSAFSEKLIQDTQEGLASTFDSYMLDNFNDALVTTGSSLRNIIDCLSDGSDAWGNFGKSFVESTKSLTSNMGSLMTTAGLKLLIEGGAEARGQAFALLAAGGLTSVISGFMSAGQDDTDEKIRKLDKLKSDLKDLIQQAKADAIYYESNLSHKKALTTGRTVANYSVNDAIITPNGNVISTHPDDYLIATKTPGSLGKSAAPIINLNIQNNTGSQVQIKQTRNEANGQINIEAVLDNAINQGLADGRFDSGMAARERRLRGNVVYQ